ncbi:lipase family protein [Bdellovibrio reynosensis]|uniref:Alpha/beta hydrolase n=1 Tax=Bdellovibrio reynosensis TaxID=2835041 RepID=A0ABY4CGN8_9BACT|nr:hypothetical protein [Bdellovibrio reynosensis]UOF01375.1 hypothetical protein MNR06_00205 [Bdellovibrio reynosensis]
MGQRHLTHILISLLGFFMGSSVFAADLTDVFHNSLNIPSLSNSELSVLKGYDIYLVPGILSETFLDDDDRSSVTFSRLTGEYFETQQNLLEKKYGLRSQRLSSSSQSVAEIRTSIQRALAESNTAKRKAVFIAHSLGGLALLEEVVSFPAHQKNVAGIIFLQTPFKGSPVADVYFEGPLHLDKLLKPVIPYFNTSPQIIRYLGTVSRNNFMTENAGSVQSLLQKVPIITVGGVVNDDPSLFSPAVSIIANGCFKKVLGQCVVQTSFKGPFDLSDGMVPFQSSKLQGADFIKLEGVDHGETVVNIPFETYDKAAVTKSLLRILISKIAN